jgi:hypothetical protein
MKTLRLRQWLSAAGLGLSLAGLTGCQTWVPSAGLTLPSGRYLEHPPQHIPESPRFPLPRELANMELQAAQAAPGSPPLIPGPVVPPAGPLGPAGPLPGQPPLPPAGR